jgi:hypothetical protein
MFLYTDPANTGMTRAKRISVIVVMEEEVGD